MLFLLLTLISCTSPDRSTTTLEKSGYTDIHIIGYSPFSCGRDDTFSTAFTATNPTGTRVNGTVCCGWFKSCTIRF